MLCRCLVQVGRVSSVGRQLGLLRREVRFLPRLVEHLSDDASKKSDANTVTDSDETTGTDHIKVVRAPSSSQSVSPEFSKILAELYGDIETQEQKNDSPSLPGAVSTSFQEYRDSDSVVILDVDEERALRQRMAEEGFGDGSIDSLLHQKNSLNKRVEMARDYVNEERGKRGVFDVEDLVRLLNGENCINVCAIKVPPEKRYAEHMVVATGKSRRHVVGVSEFVMKVFKMKMDRSRDTIVPDMEGYKRCHDWIAIDMGNIVLHIFTAEMRAHYDLETLWAIGHEYDDLKDESGRSVAVDPFEELLLARHKQMEAAK